MTEPQADLMLAPAEAAATIRQQNRQLAILNTIIQTVSNSLNLHDTLDTALKIVLSEVGSSTGWICLMGDEGACSAFVGYTGMCFPGPDGAATPCLARCVCSRVRTTGETVVLHQLSRGCPLLNVRGGGDEPIVGHVSVPLVAKSRIVGQLNVAFHHREQVDGMDIRLLESISPQLAVAVENARLWEEVQDKDALRKELLKKVVTAQEEERRRISRELHDELGQDLTSLLVRLQLLEKERQDRPREEILNSLKDSVAHMLTSIHDLALELRPTALDDLGLVPALAQYVKSCPDYLGIEVDFEHGGCDTCRLPREIETTLYRIIQESLTNVARHSQARRASVLLKKNPRSVVAIVEDRGVGFDLREIRADQVRKNRLGLYGMEERVSLVGGALTIESSVEAGTTVYVEIPVEWAG